VPNLITTSSAGAHTHTFTSNPHGHTVLPAGGAENRPENIAIAYFIKT